MSQSVIYDVIIVGAGPVGMTAASELARYGLSVRIFDKRPEIVTHSHALTVHVRTQEVLEAMGIVQHWKENGPPFRSVSIHAYGKHLAMIPLTGVDGCAPKRLSAVEGNLGVDCTARILGLPTHALPLIRCCIGNAPRRIVAPPSFLIYADRSCRLIENR